MTDLPLLISTLEEGDHGLVGSSPEGETAFPRVGPQLRAGKERPILFSAPMVRALLAGTKTQTRRVVKPQPTAEGAAAWNRGFGAAPPFPCPYGLPGDTLWVREAFSGPWLMECVPPREWLHDEPIWYWADGNPVAGDWTRPKPSIHMPRWASRITLRITDVRVERLQDISREDAIAEGATSRPNAYGLGPAHDGWSMDWSMVGKPGFDGKLLTERDIQLSQPESAFASYINELHGGPHWNFYYSDASRYPEPIFDANPWCWAVSFERVPA